MYSLFGLLNDNIGSSLCSNLVYKMLIWAPFSQSPWFCFSCQVWLLVQVSCQYNHWFWSYDNFLLQGIDQISRNWKYPHLSFAHSWRLGRVKNTKFATKVSNQQGG